MSIDFNVDRRRFLIRALAVGASATLAAACRSSAGPATAPGAPGKAGGKTITARVSHVLQTAEPNNQALERMAAQLAKRTDNQFQVKVFPNAQLGAEIEAAESVSTGAIEMAVLSPGGLGTFLPQFGAFSAPYLWQDWKQARKVFDGALGKDLDQQLIAAKGMHVLDYWYFGWRHAFTRNKSITSVNDLKGLKIRVSKNKMFIETFNAFGAAATPMDWTEVYQGLQQGVVDGAEAPLPSIEASKLNEVAKQLGRTSHMLQANITVINDKWYRGLPDDLRTALDEEIRSGGEYMLELTRQQEESTANTLQSKGMTFTDPDVDSFRKAAAEVPRAFESDWGVGFWDKLRQAREA